MSLYNGPPRPGARGGRDQFNWDNVKSDKDREFYLGHSVKAATGRWQKGKDLFWYTREKQSEQGIEDELQAVKAREQELMMEALGLKPKSSRSTAEAQLDQQELQKLLQRGGTGEERDELGAGGSGLGFGGAAKGAASLPGSVHEVMHGVGVNPRAAAAASQPGATDRLPSAPQQGVKRSTSELEEMLRQQEKAAKRARKDARRAEKKSHKDRKHKSHKSKEEKKHKSSKDDKKRKHRHRDD